VGSHLQLDRPSAVSGADRRESALESEISNALQRFKSAAPRPRQGIEMRMELLDALRRRLAESDKTHAARLVENVRTNGLRVAAETETGNPTVSVDIGSLTRMVEALADLKPEASSACDTGIIHPPQDRHCLPDQSVCHELARASREAQGRVHALLESEADPDRQWQRVVAMIHEDAGQPPRDIDIDLSDNSFLYSR
jgi:hypothetical protein